MHIAIATGLVFAPEASFCPFANKMLDIMQATEMHIEIFFIVPPKKAAEFQ